MPSVSRVRTAISWIPTITVRVEPAIAESARIHIDDTRVVRQGYARLKAGVWLCEIRQSADGGPSRGLPPHGEGEVHHPIGLCPLVIRSQLDLQLCRSGLHQSNIYPVDITWLCPGRNGTEGEQEYRRDPYQGH